MEGGRLIFSVVLLFPSWWVDSSATRFIFSFFSIRGNVSWGCFSFGSWSSWFWVFLRVFWSTPLPSSQTPLCISGIIILASASPAFISLVASAVTSTTPPIAAFSVLRVSHGLASTAISTISDATTSGNAQFIVSPRGISKVTAFGVSTFRATIAVSDLLLGFARIPAFIFSVSQPITIFSWVPTAIVGFITLFGPSLWLSPHGTSSVRLLSCPASSSFHLLFLVQSASTCPVTIHLHSLTCFCQCVATHLWHIRRSNRPNWWPYEERLLESWVWRHTLSQIQFYHCGIPPWTHRHFTHWGRWSHQLVSCMCWWKCGPNDDIFWHGLARCLEHRGWHWVLAAHSSFR